jgi:phospholipase C
LNIVEQIDPMPLTLGPKWICAFTNHTSIGGSNSHDYYPDVEPFQYYNSTANPHHLAPTSISMIGYTDQANHQYDMSYFWNAATTGNLPAVSFLKAPKYQDGHPIDSDPTDEQNFLVNTINRLQSIPEWNSTAIIITYDDSGGWYDHVMPAMISQSSDPKLVFLMNDYLAFATPQHRPHTFSVVRHHMYQDTFLRYVAQLLLPTMSRVPLHHYRILTVRLLLLII